ncbi:MAG TPA: glycosyltransferase, partial [Chloroflexota bacterium]
MKLVVFGLSITSSWGNGHATTYRGLLKALSSRGVDVHFVEKAAPWYSTNRDLWSCDYARITRYEDVDELRAIVASEAARADIVLVGSYFPEGVLLTDLLQHIPGPRKLFYDIDTPVTLQAFEASGTAGYLRADQIPLFDAVLSFTGGRALEELDERWGARRAVALYCALDPAAHSRVAADGRFLGRLGYMGTYSPDRHAAWEQLFLESARRFPGERFLLAGPQYPPMEMPPNVVHLVHVPPPDHPAFYSST